MLKFLSWRNNEFKSEGDVAGGYSPVVFIEARPSLQLFHVSEIRLQNVDFQPERIQLVLGSYLFCESSRGDSRR